MPKVKGKGSKSQKGSTSGSRKRVASAAFPAENGRDEFFEGSDSDAPSKGEEQDHQAETPAEKRLRLGIVRPLPLLRPENHDFGFLNIPYMMQPRSTCIK